jgi:hypothetical protein
LRAIQEAAFLRHDTDLENSAVPKPTPRCL